MSLTAGTRLGTDSVLSLRKEVILVSRAMLASVLVALIGVSSIAQAPQVPLFAFVSPDAAAGWQAVNDGVMGGMSDGRFRITERQTLEFYGTLSLENNGGFASVRSQPRTLGLQAGDTLVSRVRGDGREYQMNLYTSRQARALSYRAPVQTRSGEWIEVALPLDRFEATSFGQVLRGPGPVDPRSITSIGFLLAEKRPGPFVLEVAWVRVLRGPDPSAQQTPTTLEESWTLDYFSTPTRTPDAWAAVR